MTKDEIEKTRSLLTKEPELVPLTQEQKDCFLGLWKRFPTYAARRKIVGIINDLFGNRLRYRDLLRSAEDIEMFNSILRDEQTRF